MNISCHLYFYNVHSFVDFDPIREGCLVPDFKNKSGSQEDLFHIKLGSECYISCYPTLERQQSDKYAHELYLHLNTFLCHSITANAYLHVHLYVKL